jgi:hypothetical protein
LQQDPQQTDNPRILLSSSFWTLRGQRNSLLRQRTLLVFSLHVAPEVDAEIADVERLAKETVEKSTVS